MTTSFDCRILSLLKELQCAVSCPKSTKDVFDIQEACHSPNTMVSRDRNVPSFPHLLKCCAVDFCECPPASSLQIEF